MPGPAIVLNQDQADDLRELIALTVILQEWLEYAGDGILDDLASFAYRDTLHPRSYVDWLTEAPKTSPASPPGSAPQPQNSHATP